MDPADQVGERSWLLCRAGICAEDFEAHIGELRAACGAREARVTRNTRWSQLVTIDIIRRDTLAASEPSPRPHAPGHRPGPAMAAEPAAQRGRHPGPPRHRDQAGCGMNRLTRIASLLRPCAVPDLAHGFEMCPCGTGGSWPCTKTIAAWLAAGLDPPPKPPASPSRPSRPLPRPPAS